MRIQVKQDWKENKYGVVRKGGTMCMFAAPPARGAEISKHEALFFAAYIVAAMDMNGEDFQQILRQVRTVKA